ncbi:MAG TPA: DUF1194 domain-containing protein [Acetobacteraceae bacterium]|nr:DUF1194 domain-containing protein [Acetobacteraceae bacterium]
MRALALSLLLLCSPIARAAEPVDLALVLVSDVSRSVDDSEFKLEKDGYAAAFVDPRVLAAIKGGPVGAIAVAYVEFAGSYEVRTVLDWRIIRDEPGARAWTDALVAAPRSYWGRTSISAGIDRAMQLLAESPFESQRRVIDVAGDGTNNSGREVTAARDEAVAAGVVVNGLAIINENPVSYTFAHVQPPGGLPNWYKENVTGGAGNFVVEVHSFKEFGEAMTRKLINEIAGTAPGTRLARGK